MTHQLQYLDQADNILILDKDGFQSFFGSFQELKDSESRGNSVRGFADNHSGSGSSSSSSSRGGGGSGNGSPSRDYLKFDRSRSSKSLKSALVSDRDASEADSLIGDDTNIVIVTEDKATGQIPVSLYFEYFSLGGVLNGCAVLAVFLVSQALAMVTEYWLKWWATAQFGAQSDSMYVLTLGLLSFGCVVIGFLRAVFWFRFSLAAASNMHESCLWAVVHTPLLFFISNPTGRILNRFAKDQNQVDEQLPVTVFTVLDIGLLVVSSVVLICVTFWYMIFLLPPMVYVFVVLQRRYLRTSREIKRWEAVSRSPIYSDFSATLDGLVTLRAYRLQVFASSRFQHSVDGNGRAWFSFLMCSRWLGFRLDLLSNVFLVFAAYMSAILGDRVNLGLVGFALVYSINLAGVLQWAVRQSAEAETQMTSVERIKSYSTLLPEEGYSSTLTNHKGLSHLGGGNMTDNNNNNTTNTPTPRVLRVENLSVSYREDLDPVLNNICLTIPPGSKVGICGRTGSGKSTLLSSLLRLNLVTEGDVLLGETSILRDCDLETARSLLSIIPQEPHLFSGSVRFNVDPFSAFSDVQIWSALKVRNNDINYFFVLNNMLNI